MQNAHLEAAGQRILTPRQLAEAIGVSESSVKRWVDDGRIAATRTAGGHRRIAIQEAVRYMREQGVPVLRPDVLGLHDLAAVGESGERLEVADEAGDRLFDYLKAGAAAEARGVVLSTYLAGSSVGQIVDGPLAHAMSRIGELWLASPKGVFWEHRATQIAIQAMNRLGQLLPSPTAAPAAVGGAPSGDPYILPSLAVATVLSGEGLRATDLGPDTPTETLTLAARDLDARLVWLSVSVAGDELRREIEDLAATVADRGGILVVGGSLASRLALPRTDAVYVGRSMAELEALVQGMRLIPRSPSSTSRALSG